MQLVGNYVFLKFVKGKEKKENDTQTANELRSGSHFVQAETQS